MPFLVVDSVEIPVLEGTWEEIIEIPGSSDRTETGVLRTVRAGNPRSVFRGQSVVETAVELNAFLALLNAPGDKAVSGDGPRREVVCESEATPADALSHRPRSGPTAMWRFRFRLIEAE